MDTFHRWFERNQNDFCLKLVHYLVFPDTSPLGQNISQSNPVENVLRLILRRMKLKIKFLALSSNNFLKL